MALAALHNDAAQPPAAPGRNLAKQVGAQIKKHRLARGWTLKVLAGRMQTTPQTAQRLEAGTMTMSVPWVECFCEALEIEPWQLLAVDGLVGRANDNAVKAQLELAALRQGLKALYLDSLCEMPNTTVVRRRGRK